MKPLMLLSIFLIFFCSVAVHAQETETGLTLADQRRIIGLVLEGKFKKSPRKTIYVSTINLPEEIQKDFPAIKNIQIQLVSEKDAVGFEPCPYEFGKFEFIDKYVSVTFGNCIEGLAYDFIKNGDEWEPAGLVITKPILY
jgi:hypothetical protein